jgi:hypothetical protein
MIWHSTILGALSVYGVSVFMATCNSLRLVIWRHRGPTGCAHLLVRRKLIVLRAFLLLTWPLVLPCLIVTICVWDFEIGGSTVFHRVRCTHLPPSE